MRSSVCRTAFPRRQRGFAFALVLIPIVVAEFAVLGWGVHHGHQQDLAKAHAAQAQVATPAFNVAVTTVGAP